MEPNNNPEISPFSQFCLKSLSPLTAQRSPGMPMDVDSPFINNESKPSQNPSRYTFLDQNSGLPSKSNTCKCRKTFCLKLYCDCFANGEYCLGCGCMECKNLAEYETERRESIGQIMERNPDAFRRTQQTTVRACNCRRSGCLKKYCECYASGVGCNQSCKCEGCSNNKF